MGLRKLERNMVKNQGTSSSFKERWEKFREEKYGEGNVPRNTMKKKQIHFDSSDQCFRALEWQRDRIAEYRESLNYKEEDEADTVTI